ncbi:MAG: hypothetical protein LBL13_13330, partial [Bacteroidales bacterium]|nr:hypothetical protein [Bacteroidales bacterium]
FIFNQSGFRSPIVIAVEKIYCAKIHKKGTKKEGEGTKGRKGKKRDKGRKGKRRDKEKGEEGSKQQAASNKQASHEE